MGLASQQARRAGAVDRGPARAPRRRAPPRPRGSPTSRRRSRRTASCSRSATTRSRTSAPTSGARSRRRSTACTARSPAPTASGTSPPGTASCSRTRSRRGSTAASAARSSTSRSSGRWRSPRAGLGLDPAELRRRNLVPRRRDALPHAVGRALRLRRLRGLPRRRARARPLRGAARRAARAREEGRLVGIGVACVVEPSISNMGYITLAQTAGRARADAAEVGQRRGRDRSRSTRSAASPSGIATTPQGQGHRTVAAQVVADALGVRPEDVDVLSEIGHGDERRGPSPRATTPRASPASARARCTSPR